MPRSLKRLKPHKLMFTLLSNVEDGSCHYLVSFKLKDYLQGIFIKDWLTENIKKDDYIFDNFAVGIPSTDRITDIEFRCQEDMNLFCLIWQPEVLKLKVEVNESL
jgi:hypothetical protein